MKITFKKILAAAAIGVGVYAAVKAFKKYNAPIEQTMTVSDKKWEKVETVSEWQTEEGEGWDVPDNAYDVKSTLKLRDVNDTLTDALEMGISTGQIFKADGTIDTVTMTNVATSPKRVMAKWYTWKVDTWVFKDSVHTVGRSESNIAYRNDSGVDFDPKKVTCLGDRKVSSRTVKFIVTGVNDETGVDVSIEVSPTIYDLAKTGGKIRYTITKLSKKPKNVGVINPFGGAEEAGDKDGEVNSEAK